MVHLLGNFLFITSQSIKFFILYFGSHVLFSQCPFSFHYSPFISATPQYMELLGQIRSEPKPGTKLQLWQCRILNPLCRTRTKPVSQPSQDANPVVPQRELLFHFLTVFTASYFMDIISSLSEDTNNFCFVFSSALCTISFKHFGLLVHSGLPLLSWRVPSNIW